MPHIDTPTVPDPTLDALLDDLESAAMAFLIGTSAGERYNARESSKDATATRKVIQNYLATVRRQERETLEWQPIETARTSIYGYLEKALPYRGISPVENTCSANTITPNICKRAGTHPTASPSIYQKWSLSQPTGCHSKNHPPPLRSAR